MNPSMFAMAQPQRDNPAAHYPTPPFNMMANQNAMLMKPPAEPARSGLGFDSMGLPDVWYDQTSGVSPISMKTRIAQALMARSGQFVPPQGQPMPQQGMPGTQSGTQQMPPWMAQLIKQGYGVRP